MKPRALLIILAGVLLLVVLGFAAVALLASLIPGVGHEHFRGWIANLLVFGFAKLGYSLALAVVLTVSGALAAATASLGFIFAFVLQTTYVWAVIIYRKTILRRLAGVIDPRGDRYRSMWASTRKEARQYRRHLGKLRKLDHAEDLEAREDAAYERADDRAEDADYRLLDADYRALDSDYRALEREYHDEAHPAGAPAAVAGGARPEHDHAPAAAAVAEAPAHHDTDDSQDDGDEDDGEDTGTHAEQRAGRQHAAPEVGPGGSQPASARERYEHMTDDELADELEQLQGTRDHATARAALDAARARGWNAAPSTPAEAHQEVVERARVAHQDMPDAWADEDGYEYEDGDEGDAPA